MKTISIQRFQKEIESGEEALVIDVRSPAEYRSHHIEASMNTPLDHVKKGALEGVAQKDETIYLICQSGGRSGAAARLLEESGFDNAISVEGGLNAWKAAGNAVVTGKTVMSIERQVRIGAGSLVFAGVLLAITIHPGFLVIPAFVGAGLVFAGVTDWCGMGLVLAKMPWNK